MSEESQVNGAENLPEAENAPEGETAVESVGMSLSAKNFVVSEICRVLEMPYNNRKEAGELITALRENDVVAVIFKTTASDKGFDLKLAAFKPDGEPAINTGFGVINPMVVGNLNFANAFVIGAEIDFITPWANWFEYNLIEDPDAFANASSEIQVENVRRVSKENMAGLINDPIFYDKEIAIQGDRVTVTIRRTHGGKPTRHLFLLKTVVDTSEDGTSDTEESQTNDPSASDTDASSEEQVTE